MEDTLSRGVVVCSNFDSGVSSPSPSPSAADFSAQILPDPKLINSSIPNPLYPEIFDSSPFSHEERSNVLLTKLRTRKGLRKFPADTTADSDTGDKDASRFSSLKIWFTLSSLVIFCLLCRASNSPYTRLERSISLQEV